MIKHSKGWKEIYKPEFTAKEMIMGILGTFLLGGLAWMFLIALFIALP